MAFENLSASDILQVVSRSFAVCIPLLDSNKRAEVENQYLLARFIDTIEDSSHSISDKKQLAQDFLKVINSEKYDCTVLIGAVRQKVIDEHDLALIDNFKPIVETFRSFDDTVKQCAFHCLSEMARGMMLYQEKRILSFEDLDDYCYFVAGTVGKYLTALVKSKDGIELDTEKALANGRFLQKVNIIKDFTKDFSEGRLFWPQELFSDTTPEELMNGKSGSVQSMNILSRIIGSTRKDEQATAAYLSSIPDSIPGYRAFCIVPALMAHETLRLMKDNPAIFKNGARVKVPRSRVLRILMNVKTGYYSNKRLAKIFDKQ